MVCTVERAYLTEYDEKSDKKPSSLTNGSYLVYLTLKSSLYTIGWGCSELY